MVQAAAAGLPRPAAPRAGSLAQQVPAVADRAAAAVADQAAAEAVDRVAADRVVADRAEAVDRAAEAAVDRVVVEGVGVIDVGFSGGLAFAA